MTQITKKVLKPYFQAILNGRKKFELRLADWECKPGDTLLLQEWDENSNQPTGRSLIKKVTYVLKTKDVSFWKPEDLDKFGFQIISFD